MKKFNVVAASAVALSAALASGSALAHGTLAVGTANYNAAAIAADPAPTVITVPWNGVGPAGVFGAYTVTNISNVVTTSLEVNSRFTVTLPAGFSFNSAPSLVVGGAAPATSVAPLFSGGIGSQTATFIINPPNAQIPPNPNPPPLPAGTILSLNQVAVQGATALATPGTSLPITVQATANSQTNNDDLTPVSANLGTPAFTSDAGVTATFTGGGGFIDLATPTLGTKFGVAPPDTTTLSIGVVQLSSSGSLSADGVSHGLNSTDTATLSISGFFNGITSASATNGASVVTVTPSAGALTFAAVPVGSGSNNITLLANGTTLLQANPAGFKVAFTPSAAVTDFLGGSATDSTDSITYTNGQVLGPFNFLTGADAGYTSLVRINNAGNATATLFGVAEPYTGGPALVGQIGTIGAGIGTVFTEAQVGTALGLSLANSGQRATLTIIATGGASGGPVGNANVAASTFLVNPGGVVDNVN